MQVNKVQSKTDRIGNLLFSLFGIAAIVIGLIGTSFGSAWSPRVYELLFGFKIIEIIDSFMPYFPFVPFFPILFIMLGAFLIVKSKG